VRRSSAWTAINAGQNVVGDIRGRLILKTIAKLTKGVGIVALTARIGHVPALAATFVYVSNAEDGDIGVCSVQADGSLKAGERTKAANIVMPMEVSPDKRFLYAAARSKPYSVFVYAIDRNTGALKPLKVPACRELSVHFARQDRALFVRGVVRREPDQRQCREAGRERRAGAAPGDTGGP
jgi:hypothetical protein